jgi:hypothetical protein
VLVTAARESYRDMIARHDRERETPDATAPRQDIATNKPAPPDKPLSHRELAAEHDRQTATADWRATPDEARRNLPAELMEEWDEQHAFDARLATMQTTLQHIGVSICDAEAIDTFIAGRRTGAN